MCYFKHLFIYSNNCVKFNLIYFSFSIPTQLQGMMKISLFFGDTHMRLFFIHEDQLDNEEAEKIMND